MHLRPRHIFAQLKKRARIFPILGLVGPRQVGKSTILREVWSNAVKGVYVTFDREETRERAARSAEQFLLAESEDLSRPLIIDEAHKAPQIFDALKVLVDENRRVGLFTISGSVEFSHAGGVRETLTGRIGVSRLFPFTVREAHSHPFGTPWISLGNPKSICSAAELELWLERGGMPGICRLRDGAERGAVVEELLNSICYRDLYQMKGARFDGALARKILQVVSRLPAVTIAQIAKEARSTARKIEKHVQALESLFILHRLDPHPMGVGKARYVVFDGAIARYLGASREGVLITLFINELLAQYEYSGLARPELYYYRTRNGSEVDLVVKGQNGTIGVRIEYDSKISLSAERSLAHFIAKEKGARGIVLAPIIRSAEIDSNIRALPWLAVL